MSYRVVPKALLLLFACASASADCCAADQNNNEKWRDQQTWSEFTDKEETHTFKMSRRQPANTPKTGTVTPTGQPPQEPPSGITGYVLDAAPPMAPAPNQIQTTVLPAPGFDPFMGPGYVPQYYNTRSNFGFGPFFRSTQRYGWTTPYVGPGALLSPSVGGPWLPGNRTVQTGPSKASGNYYNASTPDPTASGSYYADPGNTPKLRPIYSAPQSPRDYWGPTGNPFADGPRQQPESKN